jgi:hypothetical protein
MKNLFKKTFYTITGLFTPFLVFAGDSVPSAGSGGRTATDLLGQVAGIVQAIIPIIIGAAVLVFLWGVLRYFFSKDDKSRKESINYIVWGIIALFVMVAIWGLVNILQSTFLSNANPSEAPREEVNSLVKKPETEGANFDSGSPILDLIKRVGEIIEAAIPVVMLLAVLYILWNVLRLAFSDSKNRDVFKKYILWGVIALTVMAFVWSLVVILQQTVFERTDPTSIGGSEKAIEELQKNPTQDGGATGPVNTGRGINTVIVKVIYIINDAIPVLISFGIVIFLWGVFKYFSSNSSKIKSEGVGLMTWGVVVLLIIGSAWGFVNLIGGTAGINLEQQPNIRKQGVSPGELIIK